MMTTLIATLAIGTVTKARGQIAAEAEARTVAENWFRLIVARDGGWGSTPDPKLGELVEFRRGELLLGYYVPVAPQGYIVISSLTDFPPIKAYSTTSNLDPDRAVGMAALLKDVLEARATFLIERYGGLDSENLSGLSAFTEDRNRQTWSYLLEGGDTLLERFRSLSRDCDVGVGPLLSTSWHQRPPYNNNCIDPNNLDPCDWPDYGDFNHNHRVGCIPLAMAQIMRYYAWPPFYDGEHYDWPNMLNRYVYDGAGWFNNEHGDPVTQAQIDAVADICSDAGESLRGSGWPCGIGYGCNVTYSIMCHELCPNARGSFEGHFYYGTEGHQPECVNRDEYTQDEWWDIITTEIDLHRPVDYRIANGPDPFPSFDHSIIVDGYETIGTDMVYANYGWDNAHSTCYSLDWFDCDSGSGFQQCNYNSEYLIRNLFPRNGLCGLFSTDLGPRNGDWDLHDYVYCDAWGAEDVVIEGGAWVQFLPGNSLGSYVGTVTIGGRPSEPPLGATRFFSEGDPTRGLRIGEGGNILIHAGGAIRVH